MTTTATATAVATLPPPSDVQLTVTTSYFDTTVNYSTDGVAFTERPLLGQKRWTTTIALNAITGAGAVFLNVDAKPASDAERGVVECSVSVDGQLFDRDYYNAPAAGPDTPFVACRSTLKALLARRPIQN